MLEPADHLRGFAFHLLCPVSFPCSFICFPGENRTSGLGAVFQLPLGELLVVSFPETYSQAEVRVYFASGFCPTCSLHLESPFCRHIFHLVIPGSALRPPPTPGLEVSLTIWSMQAISLCSALCPHHFLWDP